MSKKNLVWCDQSLHQYDAEKFADCPNCRAIENAVNNPDPDSINTYFRSGEPFERSVDGLLFVDTDELGRSAPSLSGEEVSAEADEELLFDDVDIEFDQPFSLDAVFELDSGLDSASPGSYESSDLNLRGEPTQSHMKEASDVLSVVVAPESNGPLDPETVTHLAENSSVGFDIAQEISCRDEEYDQFVPQRDKDRPRDMVEAGDFVEFDSKEVLLDPLYDDMVRDLPARKIVGWVVVAEGKGQGESFNLYEGNNSIGRSLSANVSLFFGKSSDLKVSRNNQCDICFDATTCKFTLSHGSSRNKTRLNGEVVIKPVELKPNDRIGVGRTILMFMPLCGPSFSWND